MTLKTWNCTDGNCHVEILADTAKEAAENYVDGGDWNVTDTTTFITVYVTPEGGDEYDTETITVTIEPDEPRCEDEEEHDWQAPHEVVGGLEENPGVSGHGGGVVSTEVCAHCGAYKVTDTWAQNRATGEQGLESITYQEADATSTEWVRSIYEDTLRLTIKDADDLDALFEGLLKAEDEGVEVDITDLPTFGGHEPEDTREIWSWDETRFLVSASGDFSLIER